MIAARECCEQMHDGNHFIFEQPSNMSSWNEQFIRQPTARSSGFRNLPSHAVQSTSWLCRSGMHSEEEVKCGGKIEAAIPKQKVTVDSRLDLKCWGWAGACLPCCCSILCAFLFAGCWFVTSSQSERLPGGPAVSASSHLISSQELVFPLGLTEFFCGYVGDGKLTLCVKGKPLCMASIGV